MLSYVFIFFFFNQKTAYDVRISDWSSDVCSSDLEDEPVGGRDAVAVEQRLGEVGRGAAQRDALALAELAVDDDAGDALERLGDILVGEFADILGGDDVGDHRQVALRLDRFAERPADDGDDDFAFGRGVGGGGGLGLRRGRREKPRSNATRSQPKRTER